jgi:NodT family efflux transporter outer membrane factor (OMF) lipoprotein
MNHKHMNKNKYALSNGDSDYFKPRRVALSIGLLLSIGLISGCAVGPDFVAPTAPKLSSYSDYTPTPLTQLSGKGKINEADQKLVYGAKIPAQWWQLFHNDSLNKLIVKAIENNPNYLATQASLKSAAEIYNYQFSSLMLPVASADLSNQRERLNQTQALQAGLPNGQGSVLGLLNASVNVSYTFDVFGANRRLLEGQKAQIEYQSYQLEAAHLSLTANVVTTAIKEASLRAQIQATQELLKAQTTQLELLQKQFNVGALSKTPVLQQTNIVAQTRASLPALEKSLAQTRHQLSVYAGLLPSDPLNLEFDLEALDLPKDLPISLPSELVRQRPDIKASEALLHVASAQVGVAIANQYPQFTLSASYGSSSTNQGDLFNAPAAFWNAATGVTAPLFNSGALSAKVRAAKASFEQSNQEYRATVLGAFQNVADTLRALDADTQTLQAQVLVESSAKEALELSTKQFQAGAISYLVLLDAQRAYQQALLGLITAKAARYADTAALVQSLGGGWWDKDSNFNAK